MSTPVLFIWELFPPPPTPRTESSYHFESWGNLSELSHEIIALNSEGSLSGARSARRRQQEGKDLKKLESSPCP